eukprot:SAG11_NODE_5225_length_1624_cov_3.860984_1_plen_339_part_00
MAYTRELFSAVEAALGDRAGVGAVAWAVHRGSLRISAQRPLQPLQQRVCRPRSGGGERNDAGLARRTQLYPSTTGSGSAERCGAEAEGAANARDRSHTVLDVGAVVPRAARALRNNGGAAGRGGTGLPNVSATLGHSPAKGVEPGILPPGLSAPARGPKYELDLKRLRCQKPWFEAAVAHATAQLGDSEEARYFVFCRLSKQVTATQTGYAGKYVEWADQFCAKQNPPLCPLPATRQTANLYIGWQARKGTVRASSMRQYVAAINAAHLDCGFERPFDGGDDQAAAIAGLGVLQADLGPEIDDDERIYLPAAHAATLLNHALTIDVERMNIMDRQAVM